VFVCVLPAFCKNPVNGNWYSYNDEKVDELSGDSSVVTSAAYLLFYRRRHSSRTDELGDVSLSHWIEAILTATYTDLEISDCHQTKHTASATDGLCCYVLMVVTDYCFRQIFFSVSMITHEPLHSAC